MNALAPTDWAINIEIPAVGEPEIGQKRASRKLLNESGLPTLFVVEPADPFGAMANQNGLNLDYSGSCARKPPSLAVALNCGTGSRFLKALVKAFDRLHMVRGETPMSIRISAS